MNEWSHSRLALYARCPQAFSFRYIDGKCEQVTEALTRGRLWHQWAEAYSRDCHATRQATDYDRGRQLAASYPEIQDLIENFLGTTQFDWNLIVADGNSVERSFEIALPDDYGLFRGRVDLVEWNEYEGALLVTDYKSGHGVFERPMACPAQLQCYAWAMAQTFPAAKLVAARYRYIANNQTHEWEVYEPRPDWALSVIDRIRADDEFAPTPGAACEWCGYTQLCPLVTADPIVHPTGRGTVQQARAQVIATEARTKKIRDALRAFCKDREPFEFDGKLLGYLPAKSADKLRFGVGDNVDPVRLVEALREAGATNPMIRKLFSADGLGKVVETAFAEEDPFGHGEEDPALAALRKLLLPKESKGRRFRMEV